MARGWNEEDPDKGKPYRHARQKIRLWIAEGEREWLEEVLLKVAEKHPEAVLDALGELSAAAGE